MLKGLDSLCTSEHTSWVLDCNIKRVEKPWSDGSTNGILKDGGAACRLWSATSSARGAYSIQAM